MKTLYRVPAAKSNSQKTISWDYRYFRFARTRTTTSTRFDLKFFRVFSKCRLPGKLALLSVVKEVTRFSDRKIIKLLTFDILFSPARHSR